jgi:hypothetical protein
MGLHGGCLLLRLLAVQALQLQVGPGARRGRETKGGRGRGEGEQGVNA